MINPVVLNSQSDNFNLSTMSGSDACSVFQILGSVFCFVLLLVCLVDFSDNQTTMHQVRHHCKQAFRHTVVGGGEVPTTDLRSGLSL